MENNDLEKQKLELEKQKLELEKQKLELERSKLEHSSSLKHQSLINTTTSGKLNILGLVAAGTLAITPFLPWVSVDAGGYGTSFSSSANGFECGHGYYILLFAISALVLVFLKNRFTFIPGLLALVDGISVISGIGSHSISFMGASATSGFAIGPVVVVIASGVLIGSSFMKPKPNDSDRKPVEEFKIDKEELRKTMPYIIIPISILILFYIINAVTPISILWVGVAELIYLGYVSIFTKLLK